MNLNNPDGSFNEDGLRSAIANIESILLKTTISDTVRLKNEKYLKRLKQRLANYGKFAIEVTP